MGIFTDGLPPLVAACVALIAGLVLSLALGKPVIAWLSTQGMQDGEGRKFSDTLNQLNAGKANTPTMGGLFIMVAVVLAALVVAPFGTPLPWIVVAAMCASACLGAYDDWEKLRVRDKTKRRDGISSRMKLGVQSLIAAAAGVALFAALPGDSLQLTLPFIHGSLPLAPVLFVGWVVLVSAGSSNAVNLSDGLDGLAGGMSVAAYAVMAAAALAVGTPSWAAACGVEYVPGAAGVGMLCAAVAGAVAGFLWFNVHPAAVFMGDTGSLALGAGLGVAAVAIRQEWLLAVAGAMFVAEAGSVMLQVAYFKATKGRRLFRCSPLHHHYQFAGWKETKVTLRFWMLAAGFGLLGLLMFGWQAVSRLGTGAHGAGRVPAVVAESQDKGTVAGAKPAPVNAEVSAK